MDPDMELHYNELLLQWKNDEDNIKDELKDIGVDIKVIGTEIKEISTDIKTLSKRFDDLVASNGSSARETGDVKIPKYQLTENLPCARYRPGYRLYSLAAKITPILMVKILDFNSVRNF